MSLGTRFEHFYGHLHTEVGYFPPFGNQGGKDFQRNGESIDDEGYPTPIGDLQSTPAPGMPPPDTLRVLDWMHGENGRLIYDCEPYSWIGGGLCK